MKLSGCASNLLARRPRAFEKTHHRNIQAKFYNEKFPLVYESDNIGDSLHEKHGATLKHKCGISMPLLSFSLIFSFFLFFWALFGLTFFSFCPKFHPDLWGNHSLHHPFLTGTCSNNE